MATKRKTPIEEIKKNPDALVFDKASFKTKLEEIIKSGRLILNRPITDTQQKKQVETDYYKWDDYNSEYLRQAFNNENSSYKYSYDHLNDFAGGFVPISRSRQEEYSLFREGIGDKIGYLEKLVAKIDLLKSEYSENPAKKKEITEVSVVNNVFIVHGHNIEVQQTVARTIEKLDLNPIILNELPNRGKTLIEKFENHSDVGFAIVLLTADDNGKAKSGNDLKSRARQNVILELGYFIGKLGRERVLPLYSEGVELPSDIHGLLYTPLDNSGNWKFAVVKELKAAGYNVDANKLL